MAVANLTVIPSLIPQATQQTVAKKHSKLSHKQSWNSYLVLQTPDWGSRTLGLTNLIQ